MASFIFYGADATHIHTYFIFKRCAEVLLPSTSQTPTNRALSAFNLQYNVLKGTREASLATLITLEHSPISRPSFNTPHPLQNIFQKSSHNVIILLITQAVRKSGSRQFKPPPPFLEKYAIKIQSPARDMALIYLRKIKITFSVLLTSDGRLSPPLTEHILI